VFVQNKKSLGPDLNFIEKSLSAFVQYYNSTIPETFPRVTTKVLEQFKTSHAELFKGGSEWTIDKHRKKLMDWLTANKGVL
jgi:hypothetical protein